jgi:hypothetical protein
MFIPGISQNAYYKANFPTRNIISTFGIFTAVCEVSSLLGCDNVL